MSPRSKPRVLAVAGVAVMAAWLAAWLGASVGGRFDEEVHALYARATLGTSRSQAVVLVAIDEATQAQWGGAGTPAQMQALATALAGGRPREVVWPASGYVRCEPEERRACVGVDPMMGPRLVRADGPEFPGETLRGLGLAAPQGALATRYVRGLPVVSAYRVAGGEIPASTFRDRVVLVGREEARSVMTPLGPMAPVVVEAQALLGAVDRAVWLPVPRWVRTAALLGWALGLGWALLREKAVGSTGSMRSVGSIVGRTVVAGVVVLGVDAAMFGLGLARVGASAGLVVAGVVGASALVLGHARGRVARRVLGRTDEALASTASGMRKVSGA